jgi:hypothetical protein
MGDCLATVSRALEKSCESLKIQAEANNRLAEANMANIAFAQQLRQLLQTSQQHQ